MMTHTNLLAANQWNKDSSELHVHGSASPLPSTAALVNSMLGVNPQHCGLSHGEYI